MNAPHWLRGVRAALACLVVGAAGAQTLQVEVVDPQGRPLEDAVVYLESPAAQRAVQSLTGQRIVQRQKMFEPAVLPVTRGTSVQFPNEDTVRHHVYSFSAAKRFELKLYVGTPPEPVLFDRAGVVVLGCNIHDDMIAWVVVLDTPYFAKSSPQGVATLQGMPAGDYRLRVWHTRLPVDAAAHAQDIRVAATPASVRVVMTGLMGS